jgi:hypothetical protein
VKIGEARILIEIRGCARDGIGPRPSTTGYQVRDAVLEKALVVVNVPGDHDELRLRASCLLFEKQREGVFIRAYVVGVAVLEGIRYRRVVQREEYELSFGGKMGKLVDEP